MGVIRYERGKDGVTRESVSNDGGKTYTQTGANSSNGYSGSAYKPPSSNSGSSSSSKNNTSSNKNTGNSGGTNYSGYTQDQYNNQSAYLQGLIAQGGGNAEWAKNELNNLNSQYGGNKNSGGSGYFMPTNPDGSGVHYNNTDVGTWDTSGQKWTNVGGTDGVNYAIANSNGTIIATDSNGVQTRFLPTSQDYNSFYQNMLADIQKAGNRYTPNTTYTNQNGTYTSKSYTAGNSDLQYALEQAAKQSSNGSVSLNDYVESLYNRVGSQRADGSTVSLNDVTNELTRLGLQDYLPGNAIYTAGGTLLPGNQFVTFKDDNGQTTNSADSRWASYGGQDYLLGGDSANYAQYVNGKTGNVDNLALIFGNMANNPYAMQDPEFLTQYNQNLNSFNNAAGITTTNPGSITGNTNVDNVINYVNSLNNYNQATGGSVGGVNLLDMIQGYLNSGLQANQDFLAQQRTMAEQQAQRAASDAYANKVLAGDAAKEQMSALGLGTTGALQSALMGVQGNYSSNLASIDQNLSTMLNGLSEQELKVLSDYYNNMASYSMDVTQYEADQAYRNAQLALEQQQAQYNRDYQQQQLAYNQALLELDKNRYANDQYQYYTENQNNQKEAQANRYENLYNAELISGSQLMNALNGLGALGGNNANTPSVGIYNGYTADQYNNQAAYLQNMIMNGTPGQQTWAQSELAKLNAQYGR